MGIQSDFLNGLTIEQRRAFIRRPVRIEAVLLYLRKGLRGCLSQKAMTLDLSEGGCMISCPQPDVVNEHLYVVISGLRARICSVVISRTETKLNLRFAGDLPTEVVDHLVKRHP